MERKTVRLLSEPELAALFEVCTTATQARESFMANRVFDLSRTVAAEGDSEFAETLRFLGGVLTPGVESIRKIESSPNQFWIAPSSLTQIEVGLLKQLVDACADPELRARLADFVWLQAREWRYGEISGWLPGFRLAASRPGTLDGRGSAV